MKFDETINDLLCEMPYVNFMGVFDFELEKRQSVDKFLKYLKHILDGNEVTDKYNNKILVNDQQEKVYFLKSLMTEPVIKKWLDRQTPREKQMVNAYIDSVIRVN